MLLPTIRARALEAKKIQDYNWFVVLEGDTPNEMGCYYPETDTICVSPEVAESDSLSITLGHESDHRFQYTETWQCFFNEAEIDDLDEFISSKLLCGGAMVGSLEWAAYFRTSIEIEVLMRDRLQEYWEAGFTPDMVVVWNWRSVKGVDDDFTIYYTMVEEWWYIRTGKSLMEEWVELWYK